MASLYTPDQWEAALPALRRITMGNVDIARLVLVEGVRPADVAKQKEVSRQYVFQAVKRVRDIIGKNLGPGFAPVMLWLPESLVEQVAALDPAVVAEALSRLVTPAGTAPEEPPRSQAGAKAKVAKPKKEPQKSL